jgi:hypothetical protein
MRLGRHHVIILVGVALGLAVGLFVFDTEPPVLGWLFGLGMGLSGGAFIAAVTSGEAIAGGGDAGGGGTGRRRSRRSAAPWLEERRDEGDRSG